VNLHYPFVSHRAAHRCEYCLAPEAIFNFPFEVEHIIPLSRGGIDEGDNLALSCRSCNIHKSNSLTGMDEMSHQEVQLFHPRTDIWEQHFQIESETGLIRGLTSVGRASIQRLQMNSSLQSLARLRWLQLGLYP
jgi:hypothetical protein